MALRDLALRGAHGVLINASLVPEESGLCLERGTQLTLTCTRAELLQLRTAPPILAPTTASVLESIPVIAIALASRA